MSMRLPRSATGSLSDGPPPIVDAWSSSESWIAFGKHMLWALLAAALAASFISISGAVVTQGTVSVESSYKTLQHLDGGIVSKILVKNGDHVREGDVLLRLDDTQVRATLGVTRGRLSDALIQRARLEAERDNKSILRLPDGLIQDLSDPHVMRVLESQQTLFTARRLTRQGEQAVLRQRVEQLSSDFASIDSQLAARTREFDIVSRELKNVLPLFEKGFVNQQRISPLQRDATRIDGELGRLKNDQAKSRSALTEAEMRLAQSEKEFQSNVAEEHRKVQAQIGELLENRVALDDKLARTEIKSPRKGRVHALAPTTEGGVIAPGSAIVQIIPDGEKMVVEVKIQPQDIDKVRGGLPAAVKFPAFNAQVTPRLEGIVTTVSPAQITEQGSQGRTYFTAQIEIPPAELAKLGKNHTLVPGMPAEVYIETKSRSILSYLIKPLIDSMSSLGRE